MCEIFDKISPESVGIPSEAILSFINELEERAVNIHSFMMVKGGKFLEKYATAYKLCVEGDAADGGYFIIGFYVPDNCFPCPGTVNAFEFFCNLHIRIQFSFLLQIYALFFKL